jgi:signal transduction histidine kinase
MTRRLFPDTIVTRSVAILIVALLAVHVIGYLAYSIGARAIADSTRDRALAERIVSIKRAVASIPDASERDRAAHALSSGSLEVHWSKVSLVLGNAPPSERTRSTAERLKEMAPDLAAESFRIGYADDGALASGAAEAYQHMLLVSVRLDDQSWVNFSIPLLGTATAADPRIMTLALCIGIVIVIIAALLLRWATRPLRDLADAAERFSLDDKPEHLDETGPLEVRRAAHAFNAMRDRITTLVGERTQALAAVSHDLRTPITRVRLRSELFADEETRALIEADLSEMEQMIDGTLEFLRAGESKEPRRLLNLVSIARTIVDDAADAGSVASMSGDDDLVVMGQHLALKRALSNLIGNALKYAGSADVEVRTKDGWAEVAVSDSGPGIPQHCLTFVFEPFARVENSRSRQTGGVGLGLTIALAIARGHGGDIVLENRQAGGLKAVLRMPLHASQTPADMAPIA